MPSAGKAPMRKTRTSLPAGADLDQAATRRNARLRCDARAMGGIRSTAGVGAALCLAAPGRRPGEAPR